MSAGVRHANDSRMKNESQNTAHTTASARAMNTIPGFTINLLPIICFAGAEALS
jgi:hypothetical protein